MKTFYLAKVSDIDPDTDILQWWQQNGLVLLCWAAAAQKVLLVQSLPAASDRVFHY